LRHWVSLNGTLMPAEEARVSVFDSGFMQGIGLFETMRSYNGRVFRLQQHLDRLVKSARDLGWTVIPDFDELADNTYQVLTATAGADARVRLTVTTGSLHAAAEDVPALTVVATAAPADSYPDDVYRKGVTVISSRSPVVHTRWPPGRGVDQLCFRRAGRSAPDAAAGCTGPPGHHAGSGDRVGGAAGHSGPRGAADVA